MKLVIRGLVLAAVVVLSACIDHDKSVLPTALAVDGSNGSTAVLSSAISIIAPSSSYLGLGNTVQLRARGVDDRRRMNGVVWSSSNAAVVNVGSRTGEVTALATGEAFIVLTSSAQVDSLKLFAISPAAPRVSPAQLNLTLGTTVQVNNGESYPVQWSSADPAVAAVNASGLVTAMRLGVTALIAASPTGAVSRIPVVVAESETVLPPPSGPSSVELPRTYLGGMVSSSRTATASRTITANNSAALEAALDTARYGDEIVLTPGVTYVGPFTLKNKTGTGWITVRSGAAPSSLPSSDTRIRPTNVPQLPKLVSRWPMEAVINTQPGAHNYRLYALEVTANPAESGAGALMALGSGGSDQATNASQPFNLVLDHLYIHGTPTLNFRRCVALNSAFTAIVDSWISECHGKGFDSQAIGGWNGTGPYKIENNTLEGAGENVMFGGADPSIPNALPSDIEFRRNHVFKPLSWKGVWTVKNSFELKLGARILVEGNVFENNWADAQTGFAIVLKSTNQDGGALWSQTKDLTFRYNIIKNSTHGLSSAANPEVYPALPAARFRIAHNSFEQLAADARVIQTSGIRGISFENNTGFGGFVGFLMYGDPHTEFSAINNIFGESRNFVTSADGKGIGTEGLNFHAGPNWTFKRNVVVGAPANLYPADNFYPSTVSQIGFSGSYPNSFDLLPTSPYAASGTDGKALGPDYARLRQLTGNVVVSP